MFNIKSKLLDRFLYHFFNVSDSKEERQILIDHCPNHMLWEAIRRTDAIVFDELGAYHFLKRDIAVMAISEPLSAICDDFVEIKYLKANGCDLVEMLQSEEIFLRWNTESVYITDLMLHWMLVVTGENTADGQRLCALVYSK